MALRINPAKIALWRDPNTLQIGLGENAPSFENLEAAEERFIELLYRGVADDSIEDHAEELKVTNPYALIERLGPTLLSSERIKNPKLPQTFLRGAFAEIIRASFRTDRDGLAVLEARATKTVAIDTLDRAGLLIALGLASTGVGRILSADRSMVSAADTGAVAYPLSAIGRPRIAALQELLIAAGASTLVADSATLTPARARRDLDVLVATHVLHPARHRDVAAKPHVAVIFGTDSVEVSPVLRRSPCLSCLDHWRLEADPYWAAFAGQLLGRLDYLEDAVSAMHAAASCIGLIMDELDGLNLENLGSSYEVVSRSVSSRSWQRHPACDCG